MRFSHKEARRIGNLLGVDWDKVNFDEFRTGLGVEWEHKDTVGGKKDVVGRIVLDHLEEDSRYYTKLSRVGL